MSDIGKAGLFTFGTRAVRRLGYGAMQLAGHGVFGPPEDRAGAMTDDAAEAGRWLSEGRRLRPNP